MNDWSAIYRSTYPDLVRYLHRKVWDEDRARDLAQEAFARALDGASDGSVPDNPRAWVFRIAANLANDDARLAVRRRRHLTLLKVEIDEPGTPDPVEGMERRAREAAARAALAELSERDRETLLLWDAGLSYTEIAAYSDAYFALIRQLPETGLVLRELDHALIAGRAVSVRVTDNGLKTLPDAQLRKLVADFR
jgi:RNA polymerase sigma-70 factor (ECF subfamily)